LEHRDFVLSIGEFFMLNKIAPSHVPGVPFDFPEVITEEWPSSSRPGFYLGFADSLTDKGIFEKLAEKRYCITDFGEACWKVLVGESWKRARQGAGIGWKRQRA
jgi:hypothetical protein